MFASLRLALAALLLALLAPAAAQQPLPVPALTARVIDQTNTLTPPQRAALEAQLAAFEAEAGSQLVVLMVPTTQPEDIASYAQRVGETWKLGRRDVGDGLLIVVAKDDRRVWIATAKALEGAIPDLAAKRVIDGAMRPAFRANDYAGGLSAAVTQLTQLIRGEQLPLPQRDDRWRGGEAGAGGDAGALDLTTLAMFFFVAVPILGAVLTGIFGRKLGSLATAGAAGGVGFWVSASLLIALGVGLVALLLVGLFGVGAAGRTISSGRHGRGGSVLPPIIWGGGGWGGGLGGGGGGFGSGGGGDFGGGGAGGSW
jgi:uncharacterized protein